MRIDAVQTIKDRLTMQDVLVRYGFEQKRRMKCPLHNGDGLNFEVKEHSWRCYSHCGSGDAISFVQKLFGLSFRDALKKIDDDFGFGLYGNFSNSKRIEIAKQSYKAKAKREEKKQRIEDAKNRYFDSLEELESLEKAKRMFSPKSPNEQWHPLFVEALQRLSYQRYLVDCAEREVYEIEN
jgi:DNA primase